MLYLDLPGFSPTRWIKTADAAIRRCGLDLSNLTVLTEAATGAYAMTPIIAALAGAQKVFALARDSRYGSVAEIDEKLNDLARFVGVAEHLEVFEGDPVTVAASVDIVTNSGHLRPIDSVLIDQLPERAVIALMYEIWEFRQSDIDVTACRRRSIPIAGVNERHPGIDVFSFLGPLAVKLLHAAGIAVYQTPVIVLCDNPFAPYIERGLNGLGAKVTLVSEIAAIPSGVSDVLLVALRPGIKPVIDAAAAALIAEKMPSALLAQYWGDIDRHALDAAGILVWPPLEPKPGHMAILLSDLGPEPVIRLQAGGLRAAEMVYRMGSQACFPGSVAELLTGLE